MAHKRLPYQVPKKKRGRPVTKPVTGIDIMEIGGKHRATRRRGRPRKDTDQDTGHKNARIETEEATQKQRAEDEGQETVTTMVNYVAPRFFVFLCFLEFWLGCKSDSLQ